MRVSLTCLPVWWHRPLPHKFSDYYQLYHTVYRLWCPEVEIASLLTWSVSGRSSSAREFTLDYFRCSLRLQVGMIHQYVVYHIFWRLASNILWLITLVMQHNHNYLVKMALQIVVITTHFLVFSWLLWFFTMHAIPIIWDMLKNKGCFIKIRITTAVFNLEFF